MDFNPPDPPRLFMDPDPDSNKITAFWAAKCRRFCAQKDPTTGQFYVLNVDVGNSDAIKIGPPSDSNYWHLLVQKYGLPVLNAAGFIDSTTSQSVSRVDVAILPPFRKNNWPGISDVDYSHLEPILNWVSAVLGDPDILGFYAGLIFGPLEQRQSGDLGTYQVFRTVENLSEVDQTKTFDLLCEMSRYVEWHISDNVDHQLKCETNGNCGTRHDDDGSVICGAAPQYTGLTRSSLVRIHHGYLDNLKHYAQNTNAYREYLRRIQIDLKVDPERRFEPDEHSSFLRTSLQMGITMIHEFTHAVCKAHRPYMRNERKTHFIEPFFQDMRLNEIGYAIEQHLLKGHIKSQCNIHSSRDSSITEQEKTQGWKNVRAIPFGFEMYPVRKFNLKDGQDGKRVRAICPPDPRARGRFYPVPQEYVGRVLSSDFWDLQTARYGVKAMTLPRFEKWKVVDSGIKFGWDSEGRQTVFDMGGNFSLVSEHDANAANEKKRKRSDSSGQQEFHD